MKIYWTLALFLTGASSVTVVLNQPTSLPCGCGEYVEWRKTAPVQVTVAGCRKEDCAVTESFKERFTVMHEENYSLFLKSAKYNDQGQYMCSCDRFNKKINLEVVAPITVSAVELGNITLPCYADTQSGVRDVTWLHEEENALHYTVDGATNPGDGYEHRISLTEDGLRDGDVSLTITGVQKRDAGLYRCFVDDEDIKGYVYMLHVNVGSEGDQTEDCYDEKRACIGLITLNIGFLFIICFLLILLCRQKVSSLSVGTTDREPVQESDQNPSTHPLYSGQGSNELSSLRMNNSSHSNNKT